MAIKKFLLTGFGSATTEKNIHLFLAGFGPVVEVQIYRDMNAETIVAFVKMDIGDEQAFHLKSRINNYWHEGHMVNAWQVLR